MKKTVTAPYLTGPTSVAAEIQDLPTPARRAFTNRLDTLTAVLAGSRAGATPPALPDAVDVVSDTVGHAADLLWLAHAVLAGELPSDDQMSDLLVRARLGGTWTALAPILTRLATQERFRRVDILRGAVLCDVHETAASSFVSGIQRVVRETTSRWAVTHELDFVAWTKDLTALRRITDDEHRQLGHTRTEDRDGGIPPVIVPWESTHLWVEVITSLQRTSRLLAMAQHSRNSVNLLGYDSIPITSSVTVSEGMTSHFARGMAGARRADRVAMISRAAADEFRGVMAMGAGRRDPGPTVATVPLAVAAPAATGADLAEAAAGLVVDGLPLVLVVGSHEPRKNHLSVLHAADLLWREGRRFNLVLVGAGSWNSGDYEAALGALTGAGRPVQSIRGLPDRLLWAAYRLAHCTLFPSLNEGFGLPVAESLAVGTPVITSDFGSMRDIVAPHGTPLGGLLIDPRDDASLVDALRTMLTDDATYDRLRREATEHDERTWDDYAEEAWAFLVDGVAPPGQAPSPVPSPALGLPQKSTSSS